jgi:hypothetical protein
MDGYRAYRGTAAETRTDQNEACDVPFRANRERLCGGHAQTTYQPGVFNMATNNTPGTNERTTSNAGAPSRNPSTPNTAARGDDDLMSSDCGCGGAPSKDARPATRQAQTAVGTQATIAEPAKNTGGNGTVDPARKPGARDEADLGATKASSNEDDVSGIALAAEEGVDRAGDRRERFAEQQNNGDGSNNRHGR